MGTEGISLRYLQPLWQGTKKAVNAYGHFIFNDNNDVFTESLKQSVKENGFKNFIGNTKEAYKKTLPKTETNCFKEMWESIKSIPSDFETIKNNLVKEAAEKAKKEAAQTAYKTARAAGTLRKEAAALAETAGKEAAEAALKKSITFPGVRSFFKTASKKMPLIGNLLMVALEAPNIYRAFTQGGVTEGVVETGKAALKLGAFTVGAALGTLIPLPFVGSLIGGFAGQWVADKLLGKSFTERQEEAEAAKKGQPNPAENATIQGQNNAAVNNQANIAAAGQNPYMNNDFMANQAGANPFGQYTMPSFDQGQDYMDKDFMAMRRGLVA